MKKTLTSVVIALLTVMTFSNCSKSNSSPSYTMTWTDGSTNYTASGLSVNATSTMANNINVAGSNSNATAVMGVYFFNFTGVAGTFPIGTTPGSSANAASALYITNSTSQHQGLYGTATITSVSSSTVSGTFSFTCTDSTKITNGTFTCKRP